MKYASECDVCSKSINWGEPLYHFVDPNTYDVVKLCKICVKERKRILAEKVKVKYEEWLNDPPHQ